MNKSNTNMKTKLPFEMINKILLYNSHPTADIFKKSQFISDNHKHDYKDENKIRYSNVQLLFSNKEPVFRRCQISKQIYDDYNNLTNFWISENEKLIKHYREQLRILQ